jgi:CheY-like chemotaxis protein
VSAKGRILIVDDEPGVREVLGRLLAREGYECLEAADGPQALTLIRHERLDAVLLDLRMPGLGGMEVLRQAQVLHPDLPIVVVTSNTLA